MSGSSLNKEMNDLDKKRSVINSFLLSDNLSRKFKNSYKYLSTVVFICGIVSCIAGIMVLTGWILDFPFLKSLHPDYISMKANTAISFILLGGALLIARNGRFSLFKKIIVISAISIVLFVSIISVFEYLFSWNSGIDELLFKDIPANGVTIYPGRPAFNTCICFILIAISLIFSTVKEMKLVYLSQLFALISILLSIIPVMGYVYKADELMTFVFYTNMALHTAITLLIVSTGVLFLRTSEGFISILAFEGPGGFMARRLLPLTFLLPVVFIWIRLLTNRSEPYSDSVDVIIISLIYIAIFAFFILRIARSVNSIDSERVKSQEQLKRSSDYNLLANDVLEILNRYTDSEIMIKSVIESIKKRTGFEAIAIRIKEGEDFPYFSTDGFDEAFVNSERHLCSKDKKGNILRDSNGDALLDCMCGNILCSRVDTSKSFFTKGGSFRSNSTTLLLATTTDEERMARTRNRCNSAGYESVALVPIRSGKEIIGLLQLNDHRKDMFTEELIPFFERIGSSIGIAIMRNKAENELILSEGKYRSIFENTQDIYYRMNLDGFITEVSPFSNKACRVYTGRTYWKTFDRILWLT